MYINLYRRSHDRLLKLVFIYINNSVICGTIDKLEIRQICEKHILQTYSVGKQIQTNLQQTEGEGGEGADFLKPVTTS